MREAVELHDIILTVEVAYVDEAENVIVFFIIVWFDIWCLVIKLFLEQVLVKV